MKPGTASVLLRFGAHAALAAGVLVVAAMQLVPDASAGVYGNPPRAALRYHATFNPQWAALACAVLACLGVILPPTVASKQTGVTTTSGLGWALEFLLRGAQTATVLLLTDASVPAAMVALAVWISHLQVLLHFVRNAVPDPDGRRAPLGTAGALILAGGALALAAHSHATATRAVSRAASAAVGAAMALKALDSFLRMAHSLPCIPDAARHALLGAVDLSLQSVLVLTACTSAQ